MPPSKPLTDLDAHALSAAIHARSLSCREVMQAYLTRINTLNPRFNALVNLAPEGALLAQADVCDAELAAGRSRGWLHGVPQAIKDTGQALGFPTTFGSPLLKNSLAIQDGLMVERMKAAGCIVIGKTNMPELGLGSHTFNDLFGTTCNAWDPAVSAGGSSGGAAVALALRLLPLADGSDFMGSLRNPAAWNNVFGLRPSQGRVPYWPAADVWLDQLATEGPMARSVRDLVALLATQAGADPRTPLALAQPHGSFPATLPAAELRGLRVGWLGDLGGHLAMEDGLLAACQNGLTRLRAAGAEVVALAPNFDPAAIWESWLVWRRALVAPRVARLLALPGAAGQIKPEALWEHEQALATTAMDWMRASQARTTFQTQMRGLLEQVHVLALPATQVWPFPVDQRWPKVIAGLPMDTYHRWMEVTIYATLAGLPALSVPSGFHANGRWPAGLQLIGPPQGDAALLSMALAYEKLIGDWLARRPSTTLETGGSA
jgi:amidase